MSIEYNAGWVVVLLASASATWMEANFHSRMWIQERLGLLRYRSTIASLSKNNSKNKKTQKSENSEDKKTKKE